jgi:general secretion pathway protein A
MYDEFYGFKRTPFHVTPDPACLFLSDGHKDGIGAILYGVRARKGFICVTGDAGVGKTTTLRYCLAQLDHERHDIIYVVQPALAPRDFYILLYRELFGRKPARRYGVEMDEPSIVTAIHKRLFRIFDQQRCVVIVIDEAQNMPVETLEGLRVLSNLETDTEKLLQIILVGQTELEGKLSRRELRQLDQRIAVRAQIPTLTTTEALHYISHRVALAGRTAAEVFSYSALWSLVTAARGNARRLTMYCDNALMNGYGYGTGRVNHSIAREAVRQFRSSAVRGPLYEKIRGAKGAIAAAISVIRYAMSSSKRLGASFHASDIVVS